MSVIEEIQRLVDRLASHLGQSVAIDDRDGNLLAISRHFGDADGYRVKLVLQRRVLPEYREFFEPYIRDVTSVPIVVPEREDLQIVGRLGFPIQSHGKNVAFLWLIDLGREVPEALVSEYCEQFGDLFTEKIRQEQARGAGTAGERIRALLVGEDLPNDVAHQLLDEQTQFLTVSWIEPEGSSPSGPHADHLLGFLPKLAGDLGIHHACSLKIDGVSVAVFGRAGWQGTAQDVILQEFRLRAERHFVGLGAGSGSGFSGPGPIARVRELYAQSALAAFLSQHLFVTEHKLLEWQRVQTLAAALQIPLETPETKECEALKRLLLDGNSYAFDTVGALIQAGGELKKAAELLHVHRTTLHYRMHHIQSLTGLSLQAPSSVFMVVDVWLRVALRRAGLSSLATSSAQSYGTLKPDAEQALAAD